MNDSWDDKFDYLRQSRALYHNEDYWRFLVRDVWRIDNRALKIVDFGWVGLFLLPMLASGTEYVGFNRSEALLKQGRAAFATLPNRSRLIQGDVNAAPFADGEFDVAIAHTVLMHLPEPRRALAEMIRVTRDDGLVITCEVSRNAINAMIHVHETDEQEQTPLKMFQAMNADIRRRTGMDYNIGMKMPVLMHQARLVDIQARISDAVRTVFPPLDAPEKERIFNAICDDGLGAYPTDDEGLRKALASMTALEISEDEAAAELGREMKNAYRTRGRDYHFVQPGLITISFGTVKKR